MEAIAAPIFNFKNEISMSMVVVGVHGMFDMAEGSPVYEKLRASADALSWRLGATRRGRMDVSPRLTE